MNQKELDEATFTFLTAFRERITDSFKEILSKERVPEGVPESSVIALERVMSAFNDAMNEEFPEFEAWRNGDKSNTLDPPLAYLPPLKLEHGTSADQLAYDTLRTLNLEGIQEVLRYRVRMINTREIIDADRKNFTEEDGMSLRIPFDTRILEPLHVVGDYVQEHPTDIAVANEINKLVERGVIILTPNYTIVAGNTNETDLNRDVIALFDRVLCQRTTLSAHLALVDTFNAIKARLPERTKKLYRSDLERLTLALAK